MTDYPSTLTRCEALAILDPGNTGLIRVLARPTGPTEATWRGEVMLAEVEPPQPPSRHRTIRWREVASGEAPTPGEAIALAVAGYQKGRVFRFNRDELSRVYEGAYLSSKAKLLTEREADAAEALACHATAKVLGEIAQLGVDLDRLRFALQALADAADGALYDDAMWAGAPVPQALLEALDRAEQAARSALEEVEPSFGLAAGAQ